MNDLALRKLSGRLPKSLPADSLIKCGRYATTVLELCSWRKFDRVSSILIKREILSEDTKY